MEQQAREYFEWMRLRELDDRNSSAFEAWPPGRFTIPYALARMHYFAAVLGETSAAGLNKFEMIDGPPETALYTRPKTRQVVTPPTADTIRHVQLAAANFRVAGRGHSLNLLVSLGLASLLEQFSLVAESIPLPADATLVDGLTVPLQMEALSGDKMRLAARSYYLYALRNCVDGNLECQSWPEAASEALAGYERMAKIVGPDRVRQASYRRFVAKLRRQCRRTHDCHRTSGMTPLILTTKRSTLTDLIDPSQTAKFNLDGMGARRWHWLRPTAGLLVWDPNTSGQVKSGVQLFGTVTWWMFWPNGYAALRALDDNGDTWLRGAELTGIAVWFDRDQDGRSDPGEVVSLASVGIKGLGTAISGREPAGLRADFGVEFSDGTVLPTWDWFPEAVTAGPAFSPFGAQGGTQ